MKNSTIGLQTFWHIAVKTLPNNIARSVRVLFQENGVPTFSGNVMKWVVSAEPFKISVSDKEYDEAANIVNMFLTKQAKPTIGDGLTVYFDL